MDNFNDKWQAQRKSTQSFSWTCNVFPWSTCKGSKLIVAIWKAGFNPSKWHIWCSTLSAIDEHWSDSCLSCIPLKTCACMRRNLSLSVVCSSLFLVSERNMVQNEWLSDPRCEWPCLFLDTFLKWGASRACQPSQHFRVRKKYNETCFFIFSLEDIFSVGSSYNELVAFFSVLFLLKPPSAAKELQRLFRWVMTWPQAPGFRHTKDNEAQDNK